jgi:5-methyltetrahydropteroyltriglutamate--homocysteine methyltransferase
MAISSNLGFPRIGAKRELKKALENFWNKKISQEELIETGKNIRAQNWKLQAEAGINHIPCNDFSFYDHVLDTVIMVGAIPERYLNADEFDTYFAMARGKSTLKAMEMTKWFDTNYHYIVPEIAHKQKFSLNAKKVLNEFKEALALGIKTRPVILGPVSFLLLSKTDGNHVDINAHIEQLTEVYCQLLKSLDEVGAEWIQIDEPCLVLDLNSEMEQIYKNSYEKLARAISKTKLLLTTYFGSLANNLSLATKLPIQGLHVDLTRAAHELDTLLNAIPSHMTLSAGIVDGRNVWRNDLSKSKTLLKKIEDKLGSERVIIGPSCSLLHVPVDLDTEKNLANEAKAWLSFAKQKIAEIALLTEANADFSKSDASVQQRKTSTLIHNDAVKERLQTTTEDSYKRKNNFSIRRSLQQKKLNLPLFPTTTIGSFPQTSEVRAARVALKAGSISQVEYENKMKADIKDAISFQEEIQMDVLVHGEFERTDMVEYFAQKLKGFIVSEYGWVQSYGSRCVRPPIIFGDIYRDKPMTVEWSTFAQSLTKKPMKGMLTGPVTILKWSFVRDDQPLETTCKQLALALRDEVVDLESAGLAIVQIDEPALREGMPLKKKDWNHYLDWAVKCFRLSASGVKDETQIHTHMCYSEFNEIIKSIAAMDADVISIEASRSNMELLQTFKEFSYPNDIGPGVYDIHSPRIPNESEMEELMVNALKYIPKEKLWVNPDCGLKTRKWEEVKPALKAMIECARALRKQYAKEKVANA